MASVYRIAVIIPASTNPVLQVNAVLSQLTSDDRLVVVLNGIAEADRYECQKIRHPLLTVIDSRLPVGAGCARNMGIRSLEGIPKVVLFCDADDVVSSTWLTELACPLLLASADLVSGALRLIRSNGFHTLVLPAIDYWHMQAVFGGNMGITYKALNRLNGFDESLPCCEDTDIAWRAGELGMRIQVVPKAIVDYRLKSLIQELRQRFRWGKSSARLLYIHGVSFARLPNLRALLLDKKTTHFAASPVTASLGQWVGQRIGMWQEKKKYDVHMRKAHKSRLGID